MVYSEKPITDQMEQLEKTLGNIFSHFLTHDLPVCEKPLLAVLKHISFIKDEEVKESLSDPSGEKLEFQEKAGTFTGKEIATYFWLTPDMSIPSTMIQKVNAVALYLKEQGFELKGIRADENCFCNAFLGSYETLSINIPILDTQANKVAYLTGLIASHYQATAEGSTGKGILKVQEIQEKGARLTTNEGILLAKALQIPIRIITVHQDQNECCTSDRLSFPEDRENEDWNSIPHSDKPREFIVIVDLGGHFVYAQPFSKEPSSIPLSHQFLHTPYPSFLPPCVNVINGLKLFTGIGGVAGIAGCTLAIYSNRIRPVQGTGAIVTTLAVTSGLLFMLSKKEKQ